MKTIKVKIDPAGNPTIDAEGFTGDACKKATQGIEDLFSGDGSGVTTECKAEFYQQEEQETETW